MTEYAIRPEMKIRRLPEGGYVVWDGSSTEYCGTEVRPVFATANLLEALEFMRKKLDGK